MYVDFQHIFEIAGFERDQPKSSLLAEAVDVGKLSPGDEEEPRGEGPGGLGAPYLAQCCARAPGRVQPEPKLLVGLVFTAPGPAPVGGASSDPT